MMDFLKQHIEALIFAAPQAIPFAEIHAVLVETFQTEIPEAEVQNVLGQIYTQFQTDTYAFELVEIAGGYQFMTKGAYHSTVAVHLKQTTKKRLSQAALETLAIIAYKQPVTRAELEEIRGVNCDYALQKLLEKELVMVAGRSDGPGRPLLYGTSDKFMDYMGIKSLADLPKTKDFKDIENTIGEATADENATSNVE
ncbi:MAG: SMC-Scp complex subunit ScpB [Bacteroidota bacterium]